jgi:Phytanoyl-CoA dioxygenase (PhyH)
MLPAMGSSEPGLAWRADGFAVVPGFLPADEIAPAVAELGLMFPSAEGFHDRTDPRYRRYLGDEFAGIDAFPFASPELSLLAVHHRLAGLAETLLADSDLRIYSAEAWAKYTGAADYDQALHRDYLDHTVLVPTATPADQQLEMFVYLVDVPGELGPPHFVSRSRTADRPAKPNWYPRADGSDGEDGFVSTDGAGDAREAGRPPPLPPWW